MTNQEVLNMPSQQAFELAQENKKFDEKLKQLNDEGSYVYVCAAYDKRAEMYQQIITTPSKAYAVRGFMDACRDENSPMYKWPNDFKMVCLGVMNTKTGKINQKEVLETLIEAASVVQKKAE